MAFANLIYLYIIFLAFTSISPSDESSASAASKCKSSGKSEKTPQISAVLLECPKVQTRSSKGDCERQMMVHIRMSPSFQIDSIDKFLLLDEVYDQRRQTKAKLMAPYVIEVSRGEPVIMYPLEFAKSIRCDTCGHGKDNSTTSKAGKLCGKSSAFSKCGDKNKAATVSDDTKSNAPAQSPIQETSKEFHSARCAKTKVKTDGHQKESSVEQKQQQKDDQNQSDDRDEDKFIDNEASVEKTDKGEGKSPVQHESNDRLTIGVVAADGGNPVGFQSRSNTQGRYIPSTEMEEGGAVFGTGMEYEADDYDGHADDDKLVDLGLERGQEKKLKGRTATSKLDESLVGNKKLFQEAEQRSEEARLAAIKAFRRKTSPPARTLTGSSSFAGKADKKQRSYEEARADSKQRLERHFKARAGDYSGMAGDSIHSSKQKQSRLLGVYEPIEDIEPQKMRIPYLVDLKRHHVKWPDTQYPMHRLQSYRGPAYTKIGTMRETASFFPSKKGPGNVRLFRLQQETDDSNEELEGRQDSCSENIDAAAEESDADDYRDDTAVHDSASDNESGSNIAKIDNSGMGEEFYMNMLNYPQGNQLFAKHDLFRGQSREGFDKTKLDEFDGESDNHHGPRRTSDKHKQERRSKLQTKSFRDSGQRLHERITGSLEKSKRNERPFEDRDSGLKLVSKVGLAAPKDILSSFSSSNTDSNRNSNEGPFASNSKSEFSAFDKIMPRSNNAPDTPVVPYFPLSGYPAYLGIHNFMEDSHSPPLQSTYKILENVPQEYLPHQPQYAKEMGDPNLTVNEKINLLALLSAHDEFYDEILHNLQSEIESPKRRMSTSQDSKKKGLNKRSYMMYDDLTMRDTYDQYEDIDGGMPVDVPLSDSKTAPNDEDDSTCKTCNEKTCSAKSHDGKTCRCDRNDGRCKCNEKTPTKKIRSVSEAWYSVFNMSAPLQFLTTRVGIYRKRHGVWWKIVPLITLTSLSGIYANGNLSILFSSHVDIFQLKRPLTLDHHKIVIPRNIEEEGENDKFGELDIDPTAVLAVDSTKFDFNAIHDENKFTTSESPAKDELCQAAIEAKQMQRRRRSHSISEGVFSIGDLGYFPSQMDLMQKCPTDDKHLCLNLLDEEVPAFTIKIKQPFLENSLIFPDYFHVRIISIISDATTKGALQVAVVLVNKYLVAHEFAVCICDCPMTCGAKTTVKKELTPHSSETLSFLLPLEEIKAKKFHCTVEVKSPDQKVISKRKFIVEPTARCLCIWDCSCHCIPDLVSHEDYNVCRKLSKNDEDLAGFVDGKGPNSPGLVRWGLFWWQMTRSTFVSLSFMLFLGFLKASLGGLGMHRINRMGYNYVQPLLRYEYASRRRRFFINTLFFIVLPFIFCCKCFVPSEDDLLVASTEWQCSLLQRDISDGSSGDGGAAGGTDGTTGGGGGWKPYERYRYNNDDDGEGCGGTSGNGGRGGCGGSGRNRRIRYCNNFNDYDDDDEEETILSQRFESGEGSQIAGMGISHSRLNEYLIGACEYDDDEEERDTNYVLQALTESRESIRKLLNTQCKESIDPSNPRARQAEEFVRKLVAAKIVYRIFDKPLRNVDVPVGQKYSIRGYFVPSVGPGYQYFTPSPLAQLRRITANTTAILLPPVMLHAEEFSREYSSKLEVLEACDLSICPPRDAPCINSSNVADPSDLTKARTLDISSSQMTKPVEQPVADSTNVTMQEPLSPVGNDAAGKGYTIEDASNASNSMTR